jgi:glycosyltransferase involved in cell wall biosynthesis
LAGKRFENAAGGCRRLTTGLFLPAMEAASRATIGVVVPCYNSARYVAHTLDSIAAQTFADWRCVIVDDASSDETPAIAQRQVDRDSRFELLAIPWVGVSVVRNRGFDALRGRCEYVIFLDSDDLWYPRALETLLALAQANPAAPAVMGTADFMDADERPIDPHLLDPHVHRRQKLDGRRIVDVDLAQPTTWQMLATWPSVLTPGLVLIRAEAFDRAGGYDADLKLAEDYELWYRIAQGGDIAATPVAVLRHRKHGTSLSKSKKRRSEMAKARRKIIENPRNTPEQIRYTKAARRAIYRHLARERCAAALGDLRHAKIGSAGRQLANGLANLWMSLRRA